MRGACLILVALFDFEVRVVGFHIELVNGLSVLFENELISGVAEESPSFMHLLGILPIYSIL